MKASDIYRECEKLMATEFRAADADDLVESRMSFSAALVMRLSRGQEVASVLQYISDAYAAGESAIKEEISVGLIPSMVTQADMKFVRGSAAFARHEASVKKLLGSKLSREWDYWAMLVDPEEPNQSTEPMPQKRHGSA